MSPELYAILGVGGLAVLLIWMGDRLTKIEQGQTRLGDRLAKIEQGQTLLEGLLARLNGRLEAERKSKLGHRKSKSGWVDQNKVGNWWSERD